MYHELATRLVVIGGVDQFTRAVPVGMANAARADVVVIDFGGGTLTIDTQGSNDRQNWTSLGTTTTGAIGVTFAAAITNIALRFVRVRLSSSGPATGIDAVGLGLATL